MIKYTRWNNSTVQKEKDDELLLERGGGIFQVLTVFCFKF